MALDKKRVSSTYLFMWWWEDQSSSIPGFRPKSPVAQRERRAAGRPGDSLNTEPEAASLHGSQSGACGSNLFSLLSAV